MATWMIVFLSVCIVADGHFHGTFIEDMQMAEMSAEDKLRKNEEENENKVKEGDVPFPSKIPVTCANTFQFCLSEFFWVE